MGLILQSIKFKYPAPRAEDIAEAATSYCGLKVLSEPLETDPHREYSAKLYFDGYSDDWVEVYVFKPGALESDHEAICRLQGVEPKRLSDYYDEPEGVQKVRLECSGLAESTLLQVLISSLCQMESSMEIEPVTFDRDNTKLTGTILEERRKAHELREKRAMPLRIIIGVLLLLTFPLWVVFWFVRGLLYELPKACILLLRKRMG